MPSVKLSQLLSAGTLLGNEILAVVVPGSPNQSRKTTLAGLATYLGRTAITTVAPPAPTIAMVQVGIVTGNSPSAVTLPVAPSPGNMIVIGLAGHQGGFPTPPTGFVAKVMYDSADESVYYYSRPAATGDTNSFALSGWGDNGIAIAYEISGVDAQLFQIASINVAGVNNGLTTGPALSPIRNSCIAFVGFGNSSTVSVQFMGGGFTLDGQGLPANHGAAFGHGIFSGPSAITPTATGSLTGENTAVAMFVLFSSTPSSTSTSTSTTSGAAVLPLYDRVPATSSAFDDEFNSTTLATKWSVINSTPGNTSRTVTIPGDGKAYFDSPYTTRDCVFGIVQAAPTSPFTIIAKVGMSHIDSTLYAGPAIILVGATAVVQFQVVDQNIGSPLVNSQVNFINPSSLASVSTTNFLSSTVSPTSLYYKVVYDGTNYQFYVSTTGYFSAVNLNGTIAGSTVGALSKVGVGMQPYGTFAQIWCDFFRVTQP